MARQGRCPKCEKIFCWRRHDVDLALADCHCPECKNPLVRTTDASSLERVETSPNAVDRYR